MKVYLIYLYDSINGKNHLLTDHNLIPPSCSRKSTDDIMYVLYAYTLEKNVLKDFKKTRDMDKFFVKKCEMSNEECNKLYEAHPECILAYDHFLMNPKGDKCEILCTENEFDIVRYTGGFFVQYLINDSIGEISFLESKDFNSKYARVLQELCFDDMKEFIRDDNASICPYDINETNVFINIFKNTFKQ